MARKKSSGKKGDDTVNLYIEEFAQGHLVAKAGRDRTRWGREDFFGHFDIMHMCGAGINLVQVKLNQGRNEYTILTKWAEKNIDLLPSNASVILAVYKEASKTLPSRWSIRYVVRRGKLVKE